MNRYRNERFFLLLFFLSSMTLAVSSVPAYAQIDRQLDCNIPFAFTAANTRLPAGEYVIVVPDSIQPLILELQSADGKIGVLLETMNAKSVTLPKASELVFDRIGKREFLREIWVQDMQFGYQIQKPAAEAKLEKQALKAESHRLSVKHVRR
jgi:hypothetical protein